MHRRIRFAQAYAEGVFILIMTFMARRPATLNHAHHPPCHETTQPKPPSQKTHLPAICAQVFYALAITFATARTSEELRQDEEILGPMIIMVIGVVVWSFRTMYLRWKHAQVELVVTGVV